MKNTGTYGRYAVCHFDYTDLQNGTFEPAFEFPNQAVVLGGALVITEASNSAGTDTLDFGSAADADANIADANFKAVGVTALASNVFANGVAAGFTRAIGAGAAATAGKGYIYVHLLLPEAYDFGIAEPSRDP